MVILLIVSLGLPVGAWGPLTQASLVSTAVYVISSDGNIPLSNLLRYVRAGSEIDDATERELFPNFDIDPIGMVETQMYLLQAVRRDRIDPYYAFRLGALGKIIARTTATMANANPTYRKMYFDDVDKHIRRTEMDRAKRIEVDPQAYFSRAVRIANEQAETIERDYQSGLGFQGYASASLSMDASRSVNAITDVWYTILSNPVAFINISKTHMREYGRRSLAFYLKQGNLTEAREAYSRIQSSGILTADLQKVIGDMFLEAGLAERAMDEYRAVLSLHPERRDVKIKIAQHYAAVGEQALENGQLEASRDAFQLALQADMLHPDAQARLLDVKRLITKREENLAVAREALEMARQVEARAASEESQGDFARAYATLAIAREHFLRVPGEFGVEAKQAELGLKNVDIRMIALKRELIQNAQLLSGSGFQRDARYLTKGVQNVQEEALKAMMNDEFHRAITMWQQDIASPDARP